MCKQTGLSHVLIATGPQPLAPQPPQIIKIQIGQYLIPNEMGKNAPYQRTLPSSALKPGPPANYHFWQWSLATALTST
jgi:hypothetical protein